MAAMLPSTSSSIPASSTPKMASLSAHRSPFVGVSRFPLAATATAPKSSSSLSGPSLPKFTAVVRSQAQKQELEAAIPREQRWMFEESEINGPVSPATLSPLLFRRAFALSNELVSSVLQIRRVLQTGRPLTRFASVSRHSSIVPAAMYRSKLQAVRFGDRGRAHFEVSRRRSIKPERYLTVPINDSMNLQAPSPYRHSPAVFLLLHRGAGHISRCAFTFVGSAEEGCSSNKITVCGKIVGISRPLCSLNHENSCKIFACEQIKSCHFPGLDKMPNGGALLDH